MAFVAVKVADMVAGNKRVELWSFTELGTDTGGTFTTGLKVEGLFVSVNLNFAASISVSGQTVTIGNAAGPTSGFAWVIGY